MTKKKKRTAKKRSSASNGARRKSGTVVESDPSLEQVREILLGGDRQSTGERLHGLEARVDEGLRAIREETRQRITNLGEQLRTDIKALSTRLRTLSKRVTAVANSSSEEAGRLGKAFAKLELDVGETLQAQAEALAAELDNKTNRKDLAKVLQAVARELHDKR